MNQSAGAGYAQAPVQHYPHRRTAFHAGQPAIQQRIIRPHRADPDQDGVALRAQQMHPRLGGFARYRYRLVPGRGDLVVLRYREFQDHVGPLVANAPEMPGVIARRFPGTKPDVDRNPGTTQPGMALPRHLGVGILDRRDHARDAAGNRGVRAGRRLADMRAWLQRHVQGCAHRCFAGPRKRLRFRMRTATGLRPAAADDHPILDHDCADSRVRPGAPLPAAAQHQRQFHEPVVGGLRFPGFLRELVFQNAEDHLRNSASRASSSAESSPSTASKSLASRKLR